MTALTDNHRRRISYLRLSITDRCNLRCRYCLPADGVKMLHHDDILTYEEMLRLAGLCLELNITKVRLTGGEPLVRKGIIDFARRLKELPVPDLRLTTNGTLLSTMAADLYAAGVRRVNISLDTLDPAKYRAITRGGELSRVLDGLHEALAVGFEPIKINVVVIRGFNDDEIEGFVALALERPYHVRFIEYMPVEREGWRPGLVVSSDEVFEHVAAVAKTTEIPLQATDGPARRFKLDGGSGEVGLISPLTHHFCPSCNRLRLTADGKLLSCLFDSREFDIKTPMRAGASDEELTEMIKLVVASKPAGHHLADDPTEVNGRSMNAIGG